MIEKHIVKVGKLFVGDDKEIVVQSMTNTNTGNTQESVNQVVELAMAGCEIVRLTCRSIAEAENLKNIKQQLKQKGINIPLVADIHFNARVAELAALYADKLRINPGNYVDKRRLKTEFSLEEQQKEKDNIRRGLSTLVEICKQSSTAIRIGVNHGSLSERMMFMHGNTAKGMFESALEFLDIFRELDFHNLIISLKASHVPTMIEANTLLFNEMQRRGFAYPIHLGVTEAGGDKEARVKSAAGIGSLLADNIGDTIRVSLTEDPVEEIPIAKNIIAVYGQRKKLPLADFTINKSDEEEVILTYSDLDEDKLLIRATVDFTRINPINNFKKLKIFHNGEEQKDLADIILQALGIKYSKAEFIACPSCGRTLFNIIDQLQKVKEKTSHLKGLKIAVMGCIVNGIGEMADAGYGYVGAGVGKVNLYKEKQIIAKNLPEETAVESLIELIKREGDWIKK